MTHQTDPNTLATEKPGNHKAIQTRKRLYAWTVIIALGILAAAIFFELAEDVWLREGFAWDAPIMLAIHSLQTPTLDRIMKAITLSGSIFGVVLVMAGAAFWLGRRRCWVELAALLISVVGGAALNGLLKLLFARPRPSVFPPLTVEHTYSFPSGHTMTAVTLYGFLAILLWQHRHRGWALLAAAMVPLIGFSRVYLGVHYPSDVLGAMTLGILWLSVAMVGLAWYRHYHLCKE